MQSILVLSSERGEKIVTGEESVHSALSTKTVELKGEIFQKHSSALLKMKSVETWSSVNLIFHWKGLYTLSQHRYLTDRTRQPRADRCVWWSYQILQITRLSHGQSTESPYLTQRGTYTLVGFLIYCHFLNPNLHSCTPWNLQTGRESTLLTNKSTAGCESTEIAQSISI